jgi:hypothetical protein
MRKLAMIAVMVGFCLPQIANADIIVDLQRMAVRVIFYNLNCARPSGLLMTTARQIALDMSDEEYNLRTVELVAEIPAVGGIKGFCQFYAPTILKLENQIPAR